MKKLKLFIQKIKNNNTLFFTIVLLFISVITHLEWFNPYSILQFSDWQYRIDDHVRQSFIAWSSWISFEGIGGANTILFGYPLRGILWGIISNLGFSYDIATKITLFIPVAVGGFLIPYYSLLRLHFSGITAFLSSLFYASTTYFLILQTGHLPIVVIYALAPLFFVLYFDYLKSSKFTLLLQLILLFVFAGIFDLRIMYIIFFLLFFQTLFFWIFYSKEQIIKQIRHLVIATIITILLSLYWILPTINGLSKDVSDLASRGLFGNNLFSLAQSFTISKWNWTGGQPNGTFINEPVLWYLWIIPIIVLIGVFFIKKYKKKHKFFIFWSVFISIIGIFLTKQVGEPFPDVYSWMYNNFPGFILFREASKFYLITALGYFFIIAIFLEYLKSSSRKYILLIFAVLILFVSSKNLYPLVTQEFNTTFVSSKMPEAYKDFNNFLRDQENDAFFRTLWVPIDSRWGYYTQNHPKIKLVDLLNNEWKDLSNKRWYAEKEREKGISKIFKKEYFETLLQNAQIKYIIIPLRDKKNQNDFFIHYGDNREFFIETLDKINFLKKINIGKGNIAVYENTKFHPSYFTAYSNLIKVDSNSLLFSLFREFKNKKEEVLFHFPFDKTSNKDSVILRDTNWGKVFETFNFKKNNIILDKNGLFNISIFNKVDIYKFFEKDIYARRNKVKKVINIFSKERLSNVRIYKKKIKKDSLEKINQIDNVNYKFIIFNTTQNKFINLLGDSIEYLGNQKDNIELFSFNNSKNRILNPYFEQKWQNKVGDCRAYDKESKLGMKIVPLKTKKNSLELSAIRHDACVKQDIPVEENSTYYFSFQHRSITNSYAGIYLGFNNKNKTKIALKKIISTPDWKREEILVKVPKGATSMRLYLYAQESNKIKENKVEYTALYFSSLIFQQTISRGLTIPKDIKFLKSISVKNEDDIFIPSALTFQNKLQSKELINAHWQEKVGDCSNYDKNPKIGLKKEKKFLKLWAIRHSACVKTDVPIDGGKKYQLNFRYRSNSNSFAKIYIGFDNKNHDKIVFDKIKTFKSWSPFHTTFVPPKDAKSFRIYIYANQSDKIKKEEVDYGNFSLIQIPNEIDDFFFKEKKNHYYKKPIIKYVQVGPTKKAVLFTNVTTPFYMTMSEGFHPSWKVFPQDKYFKNKGFLKYFPFFKQENILREDYHFKGNNFLNGWYIDPSEICKKNKCATNKNGSVNIKLIVEFIPQRWFYLGGSISFFTLFILLFYLISTHVNKNSDINRKNKSIVGILHKT